MPTLLITHKLEGPVCAVSVANNIIFSTGSRVLRPQTEKPCSDGEVKYERADEKTFETNSIMAEEDHKEVHSRYSCSKTNQTHQFLILFIFA
jgi:hypothetical protein